MTNRRTMMLLDDEFDGRTMQVSSSDEGGSVGGLPFQSATIAASPDLSFPWRLSTMLTDSEKSPGGFQDIVSWIDDGTTFKVHNRAEFTKRILPTYFRMTKYSSFTRQLHAYSFVCTRKGDSRGGYVHPEFKRSNPEGCYNIERKATKAARSAQRQIGRAQGYSHGLSSQDFAPLHETQSLATASQASFMSGDGCHSASSVDSNYPDSNAALDGALSFAVQEKSGHTSFNGAYNLGGEEASYFSVSPQQLPIPHHGLPIALPIRTGSANQVFAATFSPSPDINLPQLPQVWTQEIASPQQAQSQFLCFPDHSGSTNFIGTSISTLASLPAARADNTSDEGDDFIEPTSIEEMLARSSKSHFYGQQESSFEGTESTRNQEDSTNKLNTFYTSSR